MLVPAVLTAEMTGATLSSSLRAGPDAVVKLTPDLNLRSAHGAEIMISQRILMVCEVRSVRLIPDEWDEFEKSGLLGEVQLLTSGLYEAVWVLRN